MELSRFYRKNLQTQQDFDFVYNIITTNIFTQITHESLKLDKT